MRYYAARLRQFGYRDPRGLGWRSLESQQERFKILTEIGNLHNQSLLDEGCGVGDLYPFLRDQFPTVQYLGIDINPDAIAAAKEKYPDGDFEVGDFLEYSGEYVDYVFSSGALTFRIDNYEEVYKDQIRKMYEISRIGVAFNVLDSRVILEDDEYVGYDPTEMYQFCHTLTPKIVLRHDYSDEDFTLYLYH